MSSDSIEAAPTVTLHVNTVDGDGLLGPGKNITIDRDDAIPEGYVVLPRSLRKQNKQWQIVAGEFVPVVNSEMEKAAQKDREIARIYAGIEAQAEIALAMKGDGKALSDPAFNVMFRSLNKAAQPVGQALRSGQFQTAKDEWTEIFANPSTADEKHRAIVHAFIETDLFKLGLNPEVLKIINAKIAEYDG